MQLLIVLALVLFLPADPAPTFDSLIEAIRKERTERAESLKREETSLLKLKEMAEELNKKLEEVGLGGIGPKPKPPTPPAPEDPLVVQFRLAIAADPMPAKEKALKVATLIELYAQAAQLAQKPEVTTVLALVGRIRQTAEGLGANDLVPVRKLIAAEIEKVMAADVPLTPELRNQAAAVFLRINEALKGATVVN